jgi:hypothetical protein
LIFENIKILARPIKGIKRLQKHSFQRRKLQVGYSKKKKIEKFALQKGN